MLGELVKNEVMEMECEKECHCPGCVINETIRIINVYLEQNHCECPVCSLTREMLHTQGTKLQQLLDDHQKLDDEIHQGSSSPLFLPQNQEKIVVALEQRGALIGMGEMLAGQVNRFIELCKAAHEAYDTVEASTIRAKVSILTRDGIEHTQRTLDDLISQTRKPHNVN